tara:strand:+ start:729 stop:1136 length:408 start_codon:yes stop_codon:yes gene_type:complete
MTSNPSLIIPLRISNFLDFGTHDFYIYHAENSINHDELLSPINQKDEDVINITVTMQHSDTDNKMKRVKQHITVRLDPELLKKLQIWCQSDEFKIRTAVIERACNTYVEYRNRLKNDKKNKIQKILSYFYISKIL